MATITTVERLRELLGEPRAANLEIERDRLDRYGKQFLSLSPFLCIGTGGEGNIDVSVRGDPPGFVRIVNDRTLLIPERPGNRRAETMRNLLRSPQVGIVSFVPGVEETLRICGRGSVVDDPELLAGTEVRGRAAIIAIKVEIDRVFFHCGKAIIRSDLWGGRYQIDRAEFPPLAQILRDQRWGRDIDAIQAEIDDSYQNRLY
jgi:PPOX class probable FMN-dependent enzyme